jgi:hypothetical protein
MWATRSLAVAVLAAACGAGGGVPLAHAHDSLAPPGAPHTWLPHEDWVMHHWVPFDERDLATRLGIRPRELEGYLYDDHRPLAQLAWARGISVDALRDELVAPSPADPERYALLRERTQRMLTQPHLAQHVFFHVYHGGAVLHDAEASFGVTAATFQALRLQGLSPVAIAERGGVSPAEVRTALLHEFHMRAAEGALRGLTPPSEARRIAARQTSTLDCWMNTPRPGGDPTNPYGKARFWHGPHKRGWPSTSSERRANERRVERFRRSLRRGCWPIPPRWSWAAHGLARP